MQLWEAYLVESDVLIVFNRKGTQRISRRRVKYLIT